MVTFDCSGNPASMGDLKEILIFCSCGTDCTKNQAQDLITGMAKRLNVQHCEAHFKTTDRERVERGDLECLFGWMNLSSVYPPISLNFACWHKLPPFSC